VAATRRGRLGPGAARAIYGRRCAIAEKRNPAGGAGLLSETTEGLGGLGMAVYSPPECSLVASGLG
jgi:hypothetical protein